ncbi:trifunctional transcriptional activator/DNA repair protein Ada/methylated-DNA--[protein]-cysteine S-methyltransferase [Defluviimonas aestuarii]|uniref:bifunctional transcriptional activator/DNA repair enzyme AdaA n=1 Tax=Albidovulum aestuarii TaxID=1130726 RepID=UPI00249A4D17|nr:trifunctional transcriptional activator/DNA repair protein Ada/methylated-DNA--[protein]-cysteine S-methyltransferase [Defluviimonas aestuarii]MDI3338644.1 trifunctional transcriptional activator/DNA repair protein Ada/methylated-DNA--[protein]-cysteine S-methyltransferase [Defluviimonas aestuarii]
MLFEPSESELYAALIASDESYDGHVFVGVTSTGIFCRLTCPARKPKRENCRFFQNAAECLAAGFRPCKRCHPMRPAAEADPIIRDLLAAMEERADHRWSEADIVGMGHDPSTVRRAFKRQYGITFLEMARLDRLRRGFHVLNAGGRIIDAQLEAGFSSPSAFREAFARLIGEAPGRLSAKPTLRADWVDTPLGAMIAVADQHALHLLEFVDRKALPSELKRLTIAARGSLGIDRTPIHDLVSNELAAFFAGRSAQFTAPLVFHGSAFTRSVWQELQRIKPGETRSYGDVARAIGRPEAVRAVARANGANQIALIVPCHRVVGADGSLTGYGGGLWRKQKLIDIEVAFAGRD